MKKRKAKLRKRVIIAAVFAGILVLIAVFSGVLAPNDPYATNSSLIRQAPSAAYLFGTDGIIIGMLCGFYGGIVDDILMRVADLMLAFPQMVVAIAVAGILGGGLGGAMIALGITMWTSFARLARSHTLSIKNEPYITAARLQGKSGLQIMMTHIMPNILEPVLINALTQIGTTMIGISGLSFLGLGVVAPQAEWGSMISEARAYIQIAPWAVLFPAAATVITIVVFNYLGDAVMEYRKAE